MSRSYCSMLTESRTCGKRTRMIAPPLAAVAGGVSKLPLLPSGRATAATGCRTARACGEDAPENDRPSNPPIQTAHVQSNGF